EDRRGEEARIADLDRDRRHLERRSCDGPAELGSVGNHGIRAPAGADVDEIAGHETSWSANELLGEVLLKRATGVRFALWRNRRLVGLEPVDPRGDGPESGRLD